VTRNDLHCAIAAITAALFETPDHEVIESFAYMALQSVSPSYTLDAYTQVVGIMVKAKLLTQRHGKLVLTAEGIKLGQKLEESLTGARHGQA